MEVTVFVALLAVATALATRATASTRARARALQRLLAPGHLARSCPPRRQVPRRAPFASRRRGDADVADIARSMARSLRSGASPGQALAAAAAGADSSVVAAVAAHARRVGVAAACLEWRRLDDRRGVRLLTAAIEIGAGIGGPLARALDGVADTIESRVAVEREAWAQAATARASAAVLVAAPVLFAAVAVMGSSSAVGFFTRTPVGLACLLVAGALDGAGAWWMAKITAAGL